MSTRRSQALTGSVEAYRDGLRGLLRALQARQQPGDARSECGRLSGARRRHDHLRQGQGDGPHFRRVLRQRHQRDARRVDRLDLLRPARAGSLRHRILAARRGQAAAHAEAESAGRPHRHRHRRRRRHRLGDGGAAACREGACVVLADIDAAALLETTGRARQALFEDVVRTVDDECDRRRCGRLLPMRDMAVEFGGVDIVVSNAGIASSAPIEETTLELWNRNMAILSTGYFLVSPRSLQAAEAAGDRRLDRLRRLQERPCRLAQCVRLLHRQGVRNPSGPLPGAGRGAERHPRQRRQSGCGAARLQDLVRRMARAARRDLQDRQGWAGGDVPPALAC